MGFSIPRTLRRLWFQLLLSLGIEPQWSKKFHAAGYDYRWRNYAISKFNLYGPVYLYVYDYPLKPGFNEAVQVHKVNTLSLAKQLAYSHHINQW